MQDSIIGYLLGALDDDEFARFEAQLKRDPELRVRVSAAARSLQILGHDNDDIEPPPGLADVTCAMVQQLGESDASADVLGTNVFATDVGSDDENVSLSGRRFERGSGREDWSLVDLIVACSVMLAGCLLFFPAVNNSRYHAQIATCQNNLRSIGRALIEYSGADRQGLFPRVPESGNLAVAGMYAPTLKHFGLITSDHNFFCPSSADIRDNVQRTIPTIAEMKSAHGATLAVAQLQAGGDYGYTLGTQKNGGVCAIRNQSRTQFAIMSDSPGIVDCERRSELRDHHRNVLFESGGVRIVCVDTDCWCGDSLYTNDLGIVSAGLHEEDAVIGASNAAPIATIPCSIK